MSGIGLAKSIPIASAPTPAPMDGLATGVGAFTTEFLA